MKRSIVLIAIIVIYIGYFWLRRGEDSQYVSKSGSNPWISINQKTACSSSQIALNNTELYVLLENLPLSMVKKIWQNKCAFLVSLEKIYLYPQDFFIHPPKQKLGTYVPSDLISLDDLELELNRPQLLLKKEAAHALQDMHRAAQKEEIEIKIGSAYRSYVYQEEVYQRSVKRQGVIETARLVALPGLSQHQTGLVIDFSPIDASFEQTDGFLWLQKNAYLYGFSLSYPRNNPFYAYESWHYRYIGKEAAQLEKDFFQKKQDILLAFIQAHWDYLFIKMKKKGK